MSNKTVSACPQGTIATPECGSSKHISQVSVGYSRVVRFLILQVAAHLYAWPRGLQRAGTVIFGEKSCACIRMFVLKIAHVSVPTATVLFFKRFRSRWAAFKSGFDVCSFYGPFSLTLCSFIFQVLSDSAFFSPSFSGSAFFGAVFSTSALWVPHFPVLHFQHHPTIFAINKHVIAFGEFAIHLHNRLVTSRRAWHKIYRLDEGVVFTIALCSCHCVYDLLRYRDRDLVFYDWYKCIQVNTMQRHIAMLSDLCNKWTFTPA